MSTKSADRRISTFDLLTRLQRDSLSAVAQRYGALRSEISRTENEAEALGNRIEMEAFASSAEMAPYVGAFISAIRAEIAQCELSRQRFQQEADALEDDLRERFNNLKTVELVAARARLAAETERQKQVEREREELMLLRHLRDG